MITKFSCPGSSADETLLNFMLSCFEACADDSRIVGSFMHWEHSGFTQKLQEKISRKRLQCIPVSGPDKKSREKFPEYAKKFFEANHGKLMRNGIDGHKNHSKFWLFESVDFSKIDGSNSYIGPALYISSANVGETPKGNAATLLPISKEEGKYASVSSYFDKLFSYDRTPPVGKNDKKRKVKNLVKRKAITKLNSTGNSTLYLFPAMTRKGGSPSYEPHPYVKFIHKIEGPGTLLIANPRIRDEDVVLELQHKLVKYKSLRVLIFARNGKYVDGEYDMSPKLLERLKQHINCAVIMHPNSPNSHSKYMLFDGNYGGDSQRILWTGTMNLTNTGSHQWEQILQTTDEATYRAYEENFWSLVGGFLLKTRIRKYPDQVLALCREISFRHLEKL